MAARDSIAAPHDFHFADQIGASGIAFRHVNSMDVGKFYTANHYDHGTAIAVADVDGDGLLDSVFRESVGQEQVVPDLGGGRFEDITDAAGVPSAIARRSGPPLQTSTTTAPRTFL